MPLSVRPDNTIQGAALRVALAGGGRQQTAQSLLAPLALASVEARRERRCQAGAERAQHSAVKEAPQQVAEREHGADVDSSRHKQTVLADKEHAVLAAPDALQARVLARTQIDVRQRAQHGARGVARALVRAPRVAHSGHNSRTAHAAHTLLDVVAPQRCAKVRRQAQPLVQLIASVFGDGVHQTAIAHEVWSASSTCRRTCARASVRRARPPDA